MALALVVVRDVVWEMSRRTGLGVTGSPERPSRAWRR